MPKPVSYCGERAPRSLRKADVQIDNHCRSPDKGLLKPYRAATTWQVLALTASRLQFLEA